MHTFYEFFAGGGMVRAGLGSSWECLFANDFDLRKAATYEANWGSQELKVADIKNVRAADLPGHADLAWASFPCQDLSLAGGGAGLRGDRSGTFWPFTQRIKSLKKAKRKPKVIALENVVGTLTSHGGQDFIAICQALVELDYRVGAIIADAAHWVPQSRPRLFVIAVAKGLVFPGRVEGSRETDFWHPPALRRAYATLPEFVKDDWIWWDLPEPHSRELNLLDILEDQPTGVEWHSATQTQALLAMMSDVNRSKVDEVVLSGVKAAGTVYKRTRVCAGVKVQRAEIRFDNLAGCLRTPAGGSSKQIVVIIDKNKIKSRLLSARETARLMGLGDEYVLPNANNEALHLTGDGVAVPVVSYLSKHLFEVILWEGSTAENRREVCPKFRASRMASLETSF